MPRELSAQTLYTLNYSKDVGKQNQQESKSNYHTYISLITYHIYSSPPGRRLENQKRQLLSIYDT